MGMQIFVSYARQDRTVVDALVEDLERLGHTAWHDDDLTGGQAWWDEIIRQLQACDMVVFVASPSSARSEACRLEAGYAAALFRPIVPLQVDPNVSERLLPAYVAERQFVDYTERNADAIIALTRALATVDGATPLPVPLPEPPAVPISYLTGLSQRIDSDLGLDPNAQRAALAELRARLADDDQRTDVVGLLRALQRRADVLASVARDIDEILAAVAAPPHRIVAPVGPGGAAAAPGHRSEAGAADAAPAARSPRRAVAVGAGALVVVGLLGGAYLAARDDDGAGDGADTVGTFAGDVDDVDLFVREFSAPENSVVIVRGTPIDNFDLMVGVASEDRQLVDRYQEFFAGSSLEFEPLQDPFSDPGGVLGNVLAYRDNWSAGDEELILLPAPFGGDFQAVLGGYDGATGRAQVEIVVEGFDGPDDAQGYMDELGRQAFVTDELRAALPEITPDFVTVCDDTRTLCVEVPGSWQNIDGTSTELGPQLEAAPDLGGFHAGFSVPGLVLALRPEPWPDLELRFDEFVGDNACQSLGRTDYVDRLYTGRIEEFTDCGGTSTSATVAMVLPIDHSYAIELGVQLTADDDPEILQHILGSIRVTEA